MYGIGKKKCKKIVISDLIVFCVYLVRKNRREIMNPEANSGSHIIVRKDYTSSDDTSNQEERESTEKKDITTSILDAIRLLGEMAENNEKINCVHSIKNKRRN